MKSWVPISVAIFQIIFILTSCTYQIKNPSIKFRDDQSRIVQVSNKAMKSLGIKVEPANIKKVCFQLKYNGVIKTIPNKSFYVASPVKGKVAEVFVNPNETIRKGQRLAVISSQDIAELEINVAEKQIELKRDIKQAKLEVSLAETNYNIEKELFENRITPKKDFLEAENKFKRAQSYLEALEEEQGSFNSLSKKRLAILGAEVDETGSKSGYIDIVAQQHGIVLKRLINPGEIVDENTTLFELSDLSEIFLESNVYEKDIAEVELGEKVIFYSEAFPNNAFEGTISYIAQTADQNTRTIPVRVKIKNPANQLKPEMFGKVFINLSNKEVLAINKKALQKVDDKTVVYIEVPNGFKEVEVITGKESDSLVEIVNGLRPKQKVVTEGSFWLKSKLHNV